MVVLQKKELNILTLPSLYVLQIVLYAKKVHDEGGFQLNENTHNHNTRGKNNLSMQYFRTEHGKKAPINAARLAFNRLPEHCRQIEGHTLKKVLSNFLKKQVCYTINEALESLALINPNNYKLINNTLYTIQD